MSNTTPAATVAAAVPKNDVRTPATEFWRKFKKQKLAVGAGVFVLLLVVVAILAPWIVPFDPENFFDYDALNAGPSWTHWLGVDSLGRDIFSRIIMGARISLAAGFLSVAMGAIVGTFMGLMAGYYEGWWERITMRISDVLLAFPGMLLAIGVVAILGSSMVNVIVAVAVFSVPAFARLVRGNTLSIKQMTYVEAVKSVGASDWTIIMRHILPGTISPIVVYGTMRIGTSIITAASLSFLGMGASPPHAGVGRDAERGACRHGDRPACGDLPGAGDLPDRAGVQPAGRRPARRARSQDRPQVTAKRMMAAAPAALRGAARPIDPLAAARVRAPASRRAPRSRGTAAFCILERGDTQRQAWKNKRSTNPASASWTPARSIRSATWATSASATARWTMARCRPA